MAKAAAPPVKAAPAKATKPPVKKPAVKATAAKAAPVKATPPLDALAKAEATFQAEKAEGKKEAPGKAVEVAPPAAPPPPRVHIPTEVSANWQDWLDAIKRAAFTGRRLVLPILSAAYITTDALGAVVVRSTDLEVFAQTAMRTAYMDGFGPLLVNARVLLDVLKGIKGNLSLAQACCERVSVIHDSSGRTAVTGFGRTLVLAEDAESGPAADYPQWPADPGHLVARLPSGSFVDGYSFAMTAAGRDNTLPMLTAARVEGEKGSLTWAGTDRYRLAVTQIPATHVSKFEAQLPRSAFPVLKSLTGRVQMYMDPGKKLQSHLQFVCGDVTVTTRQIEGTFPAFRQLIPTEGSNWLIDRMQLIGDVIAAAAILGDRAPVRVQFSSGKYQVEGCEIRACEGGGDDTWEMAFNPQFLLDGLRALEGDELGMLGISPTKPVLFTGRRGNHEARYMLMPVKLPS